MTTKLKKIIAEADSLDQSEREALRRHLAKNAKTGGKTANPLTNGHARRYNAPMPSSVLAPKRPADNAGFDRLVRKRMSELGWTQGELAKRARVCRASINRLLRGRTDLEDSQRFSIAVALELPTD